MRAVDAAAIERIGANKLMRNAGRRIAKRLRTMAKPGSRIVAFAGPGNNGGDAFAALAELAREYDCTVATDPAPQGSQARDAARTRAKKAGVAIVPLPANDDEAHALLENAIGVDGMFGT